MLMIHTNLIRKCKNNPDSIECASQATKMNMCLFYNKRKQIMYGSKNNSIGTRCCVYSSLKLIIYRVQRQKTKCACLATEKNKLKNKSECDIRLNQILLWNYRAKESRIVDQVCKGVLNNEWVWEFKQHLRGLNLQLSGRIPLRFQLC